MPRLSISFFLTILLFAGLPSYATIINVPGDYGQINSAIQNSSHGDTVLVAPGTYNESISYRGRNIVLTSRFAITEDDDDIESTILTGGESHRIVIINQNENSNAQLIGFTIQNGRADYGGGIYTDRTSPQIKYCSFLDNQATNHGGAVRIYGGDPVFENCLFSGNIANLYGGAVYLDRGDATFDDCEFKNNTAYQYGGAIKVYEGILNVNNSEFFGNSATRGGGAVRGCERPTETYFDHCTFIANQAGNDGGGALLLIDRGIHRINFCTFFRNTASDVGKAAIYSHHDAECYLENSIVWGNGNGDGDELTISGDIDVTYCDIENDEQFPGTGNFTDDPIFVDTEDEGGGGDDDDPQNVQQFEFTAGQHIDVGDIRVYQVEGNNDVYIEINMDDEFLMEESHVDWGYTTDDIPHNNGGPIPGRFAYKTEHEGDGVSTYTYRLDIGDSDFTGVFVVHGAIDNGETAWGGDQEFPGNNWALYFEYDVGDYEGGNGGGDNPYDVHLTEYSPCIDVGDPNEDNDPDNTRADIGAYYYHQEPPQEETLIRVPNQYGTIQAAINAAENGDTVLVAHGTYEENIDFLGKTILVTSNWIFTGDQDDIDQTIITGETGTHVVSFVNDETSDTRLVGFTIRNDNVVNGNGGGIYIEDAGPNIEHCVITGIELAGDGIGGGAYCTGSTSIFYWCVFYDNTAAGGGAFGALNSDLIFHYCLFYGNTAVSGAAFHASTSDLSFFNCTTSKNIAIDGEDDGYGGAFYIFTDVELSFLNSIFWHDTPQEIYCDPEGADSRVITSWSVIEGGIDAIVNRRVCNIDRWDVSNLDEDPLFEDEDNDDFHLTEDSPCIDQGDPRSDPDPDGTRRDIGVFYFEREDIYTIEYWGGGWWMISMSVLPYDNGKEEVFWDDLTRSYDVFDFQYDEGFRSVETVEPGPGYWFGTEDTTIYLDVIGAEVEDTVVTDLQVPWNLVGCPFLQSIELEDVLFRRGEETITGAEAIERDWISPIMYNWRHEWFEYRTFSTFYPWWGYWLAAFEADIQMLIPPHGEGPGQMPPGRDEGTPHSWYLNIDASVGDAVSSVRIGIDDGATNGFDNIFDYPEPLAPPEGYIVRSYFLHQAWQQDLGDYYKRDIRSAFNYEETKTWDITVEAEEGLEVTISWSTLLQTTPESFGYIFTDPTSDEEIDMVVEESYVYRSDGSRTFTISSQSFTSVDEPVEGSIPTEYAISAIYPNPFNSVTKIAYDLPVTSQVVLKAYDISGRLMKTLVDKNQTAGRYVTSWNVKDLTTGMYFISLEADRYKSVSKVILIK
ncbi:MAG: T9SS type A sorting domain-containing protein [Candidatus Hatepunaea meridiana]|nr:T9SS type A sorting domain-containing protein [Candidatus Hatepunaea meridiana]